MSHRQLYLDCDGVLADFDTRVREVLGTPDPRGWEEARAIKHAARIIDERYGPQSTTVSSAQIKEVEPEARALAANDFWTTLYERENLFGELDVMPDAHELVEAVRHLNPIILTGCPRGYWAMKQKHEWRDQHFPDLPMICLPSAEKRVHCRAGDVLVDDWDKYRGHWEERGGLFVLHNSASESIAALRELGVLK